MHRNVYLCIGAAVLFAAPSAAQTLLYNFVSARDLLTMADFDGDGLADFALPGTSQTPLRAYKGLDGTPLFEIPNARPARPAGDVNGDGRTDIVASRGAANPSGLFEVFSGADGSLLYEVPSTAGYGWLSSYPGDFNADGYGDFIVGIRFIPSFNRDILRVVSGRDGSTLRLVVGLEASDFGAFGSCGDMDADGHDDYAIMQGTSGRSDPVITFYSGRDHSQIGRFSSPDLDWNGSGLTPVGDVNGDGHADVLAGSGHLFNGVDRTVLRTYPGIWIPATISGGADVNGDGFDDYAIASAGNGTTIYSGVDGAALFTRSSTAQIFEHLLGDVDGDGYSEFHWRPAGSFRTGVFTGGYGGNAPGIRSLGSGCVGSNGNLPTGTTSGSPISGGSLGFGLRGALPSTIAILRLADPVQMDLTPFGLPGCTLFADIDGFNLDATTDAGGRFQTPRFAIPNDPAVVGIVWAAQWVCADPAANTPGLTLSSAQELRFGG